MPGRHEQYISQGNPQSRKGKKGNPRHGKAQKDKYPVVIPPYPMECIPQAMVQEDLNPKDNIEVLVRIRPKNPKERAKTAKCILKILDGEVNTLLFDPKEFQQEFYFHGVKQKVHDCMKRPNKDMRFTFDHVYGPKHSNMQIFEETFKPLVNHIVSGFSCSVFAYGATGSGKTYTMTGSNGNPGLTFLVAMELYRRISEMANEYESEVAVSYLEIYNETIRDLLRPSGILNIREDGLQGVNIPNLTTHRPKDPSEMLELLSSGNNARTQHPTDHNAESSRSHAVFQVSVTMRRRFNHKCLNYSMAKAKLVMVDLAGSERGTLTSSGEGPRHREGANINKSLLALGNCINALADGKKHIPYRDSKLTRLLKDSLGGNCKTIMVANVSPTNLSYDDTYNTLKYADRAKQIRVHCKKDISTDDSITQHYRNIISDLQQEMASLKMKYALLEESERSRQLLVPAPALKREPPNSHAMGDGRRSISTNTIGSPLVSQTQVITDPAALENFIQLLERKKKLDEALVKASIKGKEAEWKMKWKNWRIDAITFFSKGNDNRVFQDKLRSLRSQFDNLYIYNEECKAKMEYAKRVFNFNRKEIDLVSRTFISTLKMDDPFITVTLSEFLYYKSLEREVGSRKCIENFYQQLCCLIFDELLNAETILSQFLGFFKTVDFRKSGLSKDPKYIEILAMIQGDSLPKLMEGRNSEMDGDADFPSLASIQDLIQFIRSPVVEYEPPLSTTAVTTGVAEESPSSESGLGIINCPIINRDRDGQTLMESTSFEEFAPETPPGAGSYGSENPANSQVFSCESSTTSLSVASQCELERTTNDKSAAGHHDVPNEMEDQTYRLSNGVPVLGVGISVVSLAGDSISCTSVPLRYVPATTSISLNEPQQVVQNHENNNNNSCDHSTDLVMIKPPSKGKISRTQPKHLCLKTEFTSKANLESGGNRRQNFR